MSIFSRHKHQYRLVSTSQERETEYVAALGKFVDGDMRTQVVEMCVDDTCHHFRTRHLDGAHAAAVEAAFKEKEIE